jgi:hypothetical protein
MENYRLLKETNLVVPVVPRQKKPLGAKCGINTLCIPGNIIFLLLCFSYLDFILHVSIALHCIALHYNALHFISFHFISFHFISFHFISFHFISFHFISFHFILILLLKFSSFSFEDKLITLVECDILSQFDLRSLIR